MTLNITERLLPIPEKALITSLMNTSNHTISLATRSSSVSARAGVHRMLASLAVAGIFFGLAPGIATAQDKVDPTNGQHKPGYNSQTTRVTLPSSTIDARTGSRHVCAGREMVYQGHFDALYGTVYNQDLSVMIVDGQAVTPADKLCLRLAADAYSSDALFGNYKKGDDASRIVSPKPKSDGKAPYSFLGAPGTIWYTAPKEVPQGDSWRPLWAGLGAFDPAHELDNNVPKCLDKDADGQSMMTFDLVGYQGPGEMEVYYDGIDGPTRYISTREGLYSMEYAVGGHGHFSWSFSAPGIYRLTWQSSVVRDGKTYKSSPSDLYWLVGTDEEIGLAKGTTTNLNAVERSAEDIARAQGLTPKTLETTPKTFTAPNTAATPLPVDGLCGDAQPGEPKRAPVRPEGYNDPAAFKRYGAGQGGADEGTGAAGDGNASAGGEAAVTTPDGTKPAEKPSKNADEDPWKMLDQTMKDTFRKLDKALPPVMEAVASLRPEAAKPQHSGVESAASAGAGTAAGAASEGDGSSNKSASANGDVTRSAASAGSESSAGGRGATLPLAQGAVSESGTASSGATSENAAENGATDEEVIDSPPAADVPQLSSTLSNGALKGGKQTQAAEKKGVAALAQQLGQGGWLSGFVFGIGAMALLGGMLFFLAANRNVREMKRALAAREATRWD